MLDPVALGGACQRDQRNASQRCRDPQRFATSRNSLATRLQRDCNAHLAESIRSTAGARLDGRRQKRLKCNAPNRARQASEIATACAFQSTTPTKGSSATMWCARSSYCLSLHMRQVSTKCKATFVAQICRFIRVQVYGGQRKVNITNYECIGVYVYTCMCVYVGCSALGSKENVHSCTSTKA